MENLSVFLSGKFLLLYYITMESGMNQGEEIMLWAGPTMGYSREGLLLRERTARRDKDAALSGKVIDRPVALVLMVWSRFRSTRLPAIHFPRATLPTHPSESCPTILCAISV